MELAVQQMVIVHMDKLVKLDQVVIVVEDTKTCVLVGIQLRAVTVVPIQLA